MCECCTQCTLGRPVFGPRELWHFGTKSNPSQSCGWRKSFSHHALWISQLSINCEKRPGSILSLFGPIVGIAKKILKFLPFPPSVSPQFSPAAARRSSWKLIKHSDGTLQLGRSGRIIFPDARDGGGRWHCWHCWRCCFFAKRNSRNGGLLRQGPVTSQ